MSTCAKIALAVLIATSAPIPDLQVGNETAWDGPVLTAEMGCNLYGPTGVETWYNMPMDAFIQFIHDLGFEGEHGIRVDGVHVWRTGGEEYVIVGAYLPKYPRGTIVQTSLGPGIVLDTGYFLYGEDQFDIATTW